MVNKFRKLLLYSLAGNFLLIGACWWVFPKYASSFIIPAGILLLLACMYTSAQYHTKKLFKPSKYLFPVFIALSVSFTMISFMFGLHTDVFTAYDKTEETKNDKFKWFKLDTILGYPKKQLENKVEVPEKYIDFNLAQDTTSNICHILIIDKSSYMANACNVNNLNVDLRTFIRRFFSTAPIDTSAKTCDLLVPFFCTGAYNNALHKSDEALSIFLYDGTSNDFINVLQDKYKYTIRASRLRDEVFMKDYFSEMLKKNKVGKNNNVKPKTSLNDILRILKSKLNTLDELNNNNDNENKRFDKYKVTIVSGFVNSDLSERPIDISTIPEINELYTYTLKGESKDTIDYTAEMLIADMTKNFKLVKENVNVQLDQSRNVQEMYDELRFSNLKKYNNVNLEGIPFHYPYTSFNSNLASETYIKIRNPKENNSRRDFFIRINNLDDPEDKKYFLLKRYNSDNVSEQAVEIGELHSLFLDPRDSLLLVRFPNPNLWANNRLVFEIGSCRDNKVLSYSVSFLPVLPEGTSYYLIICYCIFVMGLVFTLVLPNLYVLILIYKEKIAISKINPWFDVLCLTTPGVTGLFLLGYLFSLYWNFLPEGMLIILILLLLFSIPVFLAGIKKDSSVDSETNSGLDSENSMPFFLGLGTFRSRLTHIEMPDRTKKVESVSNGSDPNSNGKEDLKSEFETPGRG